MGHGLYRMSGSMKIPWVMDRTGQLAVQGAEGYRIPMGHGPYRMLGGMGFPWAMDCTGCWGVQDSHGPWTVQDTEGYENPMGHGPYRMTGTMRIPLSGKFRLLLTLAGHLFKLVFIPLQFSLSKSQHTFISLPFPPLNDLTNYSRPREQDDINPSKRCHTSKGQDMSN